VPSFIGNLPALGAYRLDSCSRCHRADSLVDTDVSVEYEGGLALCVPCIGDIALAAGFDVNHVRLTELLAKVESLESALESAQSTVSKVRVALRSQRA